MLRGGETSARVLIPGNSKDSLLIQAIKWKDPEYEMPPKANDRLSEKEIAWVSKWVDLGAPWPSKSVQDKYALEERKKTTTDAGILVKTSGGLSDQWTFRRYKKDEMWAFNPLIKPEVLAQDQIDFFVESKLKKNNLQPAPSADFRTLVKRAYYDLHGLPPTPYEIFQFRKKWDKDPEHAWHELIDKLLKVHILVNALLNIGSTLQGMRIPEDCLMITNASNMWRYRDYVVRSFNKDKPTTNLLLSKLQGMNCGRSRMKMKKTRNY